LRILHVGNKGSLTGEKVGFEGFLKVRKNDFTKMKIKFKDGLKSDFYIIDRDPNYQWILVGDRRRKNAWVLSKSFTLDKLVLDNILRELEANKFDIHLLHLNKQSGVAPTLGTTLPTKSSLPSGSTLPLGATGTIGTFGTTGTLGTTGTSGTLETTTVTKLSGESKGIP